MPKRAENPTLTDFKATDIFIEIAQLKKDNDDPSRRSLFLWLLTQLREENEKDVTTFSILLSSPEGVKFLNYQDLLTILDGFIKKRVFHLAKATIVALKQRQEYQHLDILKNYYQREELLNFATLNQLIKDIEAKNSKTTEVDQEIQAIQDKRRAEIFSNPSPGQRFFLFEHGEITRKFAPYIKKGELTFEQLKIFINHGIDNPAILELKNAAEWVQMIEEDPEGTLQGIGFVPDIEELNGNS